MTPEERLAVLETEMRQVKASITKIEEGVEKIQTTLSEARGGWKTLLLVAGVAGSVGAFIGKFLPFFKA